MSPSSWGTLTLCEAKWKFARDELGEQDEQKGIQLLKGSALGKCQEALHLGREWRPVLEQEARKSGWSGGFEMPDPYPDVEWLMGRYEPWLSERPGVIRMRTTEVPFDQAITPKVHMRGYLDGIGDYEDAERPELDGIYVVEFKLSGKWDRFWHLDLEAQTWTYGLAMQNVGVPIKGVIYDYCYDHRYVPATLHKHPPSDNFKRLLVPWDAWLAGHYNLKAVKAAERAEDLMSGLAKPVENIGGHCQYCPWLLPCLRPESAGLAETRARVLR